MLTLVKVLQGALIPLVATLSPGVSTPLAEKPALQMEMNVRAYETNSFGSQRLRPVFESAEQEFDALCREMGTEDGSGRCGHGAYVELMKRWSKRAE